MKNAKSGVAVIIVLGLLALLMIVAVSFSVSMRVERAGAANYANAAKTRQMIWAGLARAIGDINLATPDMYPSGDVLVSGGGGWGSGGNEGVRILYGSATNHVPAVFLTNSITGMRAQWLPLGGASRMGYAAYMVLNLSDMLDLHYVGGKPRAGGRDVAELVLDGIGVDTNLLVEARTLPFETLAEFKSLYPEIPATTLSEYSRFIPDPATTNAVYIGGTVADLIANEAVITEHIRLVAGISAPDIALAGVIFTNLLDYIDEDSIPRDLNAPNVEAVPMLNEVAMTNVVLHSPSGDTLLAVAIRGGIETWYPFVQMNQAGLDFHIRGNYTMSLTVTDVDGGGDVLASVSSNATFQSSTLSYRVSPFPYHPFMGVVPGGGASLTNNPEVALSLNVSNLTVRIDGTDVIVDQVTGVFSFEASGRYNSFPALAPASYQTLDPRFNWKVTPPNWIPSPTVSTIGTTNTQTLALLATPAFKGADRLHCSDRGFLYSPLELGNLPRNMDSFLQTLRVFNSHGQLRDPILEHFTTVPTNAVVQRGLMNPNSRDDAILATAFRDMPHPYVGADALDASLQNAILSMIATAQDSGTIFTSLTDVLDLPWEATFPNLSDVEREALAAYSTGLMGVRQNLFLILVSASSAGYGVGVFDEGVVKGRGRQRALALVWRDPVPNAQGLHKCFIQHFQWLN